MGIENPIEQSRGKAEALENLMETLKSKSAMVDLATRFGLLDQFGMDERLGVLIDDNSALSPSTANEIEKLIKESDDFRLYTRLAKYLKSELQR